MPSDDRKPMDPLPLEKEDVRKGRADDKTVHVFMAVYLTGRGGVLGKDTIE